MCGRVDVAMSGMYVNQGGTIYPGQWNHISGPNILFNDPTDPQATATPQTYGGTSIVRWTVTNPNTGCAGSDDVEIK